MALFRTQDDAFKALTFVLGGLIIGFIVFRTTASPQPVAPPQPVTVPVPVAQPIAPTYVTDPAILEKLRQGRPLGNEHVGTTTIENPKPKANNTTIYVCAKMEVERMLSNPSKAKWPWVSSNDVVMDWGDGTYTVKSYLDAQNSFGAMIRTNFGCSVKYDLQADSCTAVECLLE